MNTQTEIKIEKGIPIPPRMSRGIKAILSQMEVGDSVLFTSGNRATACTLACQLAKETCKKFVSRKTEGGFRYWRTS